MVAVEAESTARLVPAVDRAVRILGLLREEDRFFSISELARALGASKGTVRDILVTLHRHGLVERDEETRRYRLGYGLLRLAGAVLARLDLRSAARPILRELMERTGETVFLGVLDGRRIMILDKEEAPGDLKITSPVGRRIPLTAGCFGKVLLAHLADEERRALLDGRPLRAFTRRTVTDPAEYHRALDDVRDRGHALDDEEYLDGVRAACAPIFDLRGEVVGALAVVGFSSRIDDARLRQIAAEVTRAARQVSLRLGAGRPTPLDVDRSAADG